MVQPIADLEDSPVPEFLIHISGFPLKVRWKRLTGFELKVLAGHALDSQLFLVTVVASTDRPVGDTETLRLEEGMELYASLHAGGRAVHFSGESLQHKVGAVGG